jgi:DNA-binding response OmpR family regulator/GGDEF domain-containing protein
MQLHDAQSAERTRILVLDPDDQSASACATAFSERGWLTDHVYSLTEALRLLRKHHYDLAIIDLILPDADGTEAWRCIRLMSAETVGIMTTSSLSLRNSINASEGGILAYLQKPLKMPALCNSIDRFLRQKRGRDANNLLRGQFEGLNKLLQGISQTLDPDRVPVQVLAQLQTILRFDWAILHLLDEESSTPKNYIQRHARSRCTELTPLQVKFVQKLLAEALDCQELEVMRLTRSTYLDDYRLSAHELGLQELLLVPIIGTEHPYGVLAVLSCWGSEALSAPFDGELLTVVSRVLAFAFDHTHLAKQVGADAVRDRKTGMGTLAYLESLIRLEIARWKRYERPFSLIVVQLPTESPNGEESHPADLLTLLDIAYLARSLVRQIDVVAQLGDRQFAIFLPEANQTGATQVVTRLNTALEAQTKASNNGVIPKIKTRIINPSQDIQGLSDLIALVEGEAET